jgi:hypothetical protein
VRHGFLQLALLGGAAKGYVPGCGSRSELLLAEPCNEGDVRTCGSDIGACQSGTQICADQEFGECVGAVGPTRETCNAVDDDCDGAIDEDFGAGEACDGPDADLCADDVMTCQGCTSGPSDPETCNGRDDDCDGVVDADCEIGNCRPTLVVTSTTPSSPSCVNFPVETSSRGAIEYPCGGGLVGATLGSVTFTGSVTNGEVSLMGSRIISAEESPDDCIWRTDHVIRGNISSGSLSYSYSEVFVSGFGCWSPCTEVGTIEIQWTEG